MITTENPETNSAVGCLAGVRHISDALYVLQGKWKFQLIFTLAYRPLRFNEIMHMLDGITPKVLTKELKDLEMNGFVIRKVSEAKPANIVYESTSYSKSLSGVLGELISWGQQHREKVKQSIRAHNTKPAQQTLSVFEGNSLNAINK